MLHGCDVSEWQQPSLVPWTTKDFAIVRATYGTRLDKSTVRHASMVRSSNRAVLGLYHFFLPRQPIGLQVEAFMKQADACGLREGDIVPCVDVEAYPSEWKDGKPVKYSHVSPTWDSPLFEFIMRLEDRFSGTPCMIYITQADFGRLGKPGWVLERPLWVPNYPARFSKSPLKKPATPADKPYRVWQYLVGPLDQVLQDHLHPKAVDQNIAESLPLIGKESEVPTDFPPPASPEQIRASSFPFVHLDNDYWKQSEKDTTAHFKKQT